jgi:hypothetical protein
MKSKFGSVTQVSPYSSSKFSKGKQVHMASKTIYESHILWSNVDNSGKKIRDFHGILTDRKE